MFILCSWDDLADVKLSKDLDLLLKCQDIKLKGQELSSCDVYVLACENAMTLRKTRPY